MILSDSRESDKLCDCKAISTISLFQGHSFFFVKRKKGLHGSSHLHLTCMRASISLAGMEAGIDIVLNDIEGKENNDA